MIIFPIVKISFPMLNLTLALPMRKKQGIRNTEKANGDTYPVIWPHNWFDIWAESIKAQR